MSDNEDNERKGPITVLELAMFRGCKASEDGSVSMGAVEATGLPFMGGCVRCGASVACYNSCPTTTGYIACKSGCAEDIGYPTVEEANRALFPEEYEWQGVGHKAKDIAPSAETGEEDDNG